MRNNPMAGIMVAVLCGSLMWCAGCATWMRAYVAVHDAADAALTNGVPAVITNAIPTTKPVATSCGCDLSKPAAVFASPVHGKTESEVGAWLRQRWVDGKRDSCDGLPRDVRPQALNPSGKAPFNWKYAILGGGVKISFEGDMMTVTCGDVTVDGQTQRWHVVGCTNTEEGRKASDWTPMEPGVAVKQKHFVCFEVRDK